MPGPLLVVAPHGRDATVIYQVLQSAGLPAEVCADMAGLSGRLASGGGVVLTEEALADSDARHVFAWVRAQPAWSDMPFVVLLSKRTRMVAGRRSVMLEALGNAVLLERPLNAESLESAGRSALRARGRQESIRELTDTLESRVQQRTMALAESEARFRAVFEGFPESLFVVRVEPNGSFVYEGRNTVAVVRSGLANAAMVGRRPEEVLAPQEAQHLSAALRQVLESGASVEYVDELQSSSGTRTYYLTLTPMPDAEGQVTHVLGIGRDVTERNQLEARLRQAQKLEAVGQLTGGVAHDFNNLLQVVLSGLTLMERVQDPERRRQLADSVRRAAERGGELTRRLLTVARRQSLRPQPVALGPWLNDGAGQLLARALRGDIVTTIDVPESLPPVEVDPAELELALLNLAVNARDAMPSGGTLTITGQAVALDGTAGSEGLTGSFVRLSVDDTGLGMSAETRARVFEPFFTTKEVGKGTGLGLAQVYGFVKQSGGGVQLRSRSGEGTTVALLLPIAQGATRPRKAAAPEDAGANGHGASVLVVEDDDDVASAVMGMLTQLGHRPTRVPTAAAALSALANGQQVDVVFSDVMMPGGMDGLALAREAGQRWPGIRVLLTTGYTGGGPAAVPPGVPVLRKPYRIDELTAALARVLSG